MNELEVDAVKNAILDTKWDGNSYHPKTKLGALLCDADMAHIASPNHEEWSNKLRQERIALGLDTEHSELENAEADLEILKKTEFITEEGKALFESGRQDNIKALRRKIETLKSEK